jgi:predicted metal-dependent RNase
MIFDVLHIIHVGDQQLAPVLAVNDIKSVVPETAGITDIFFDADTGEVLIEAEKPGVVIW